MRKIAKVLFLLSVLTVVLSACSKEKRIEHWLVRKDGKWDVTSIDYKYYVNNTLQSSANIPNAGNIVFDKKGSVVMTLVLNGSPETSSGTWTNTKDQITMMFNGEASVFKILDKPKKDKMTIQTTDYNNSTGEKEEYTAYIKLAD
ncbi:hypothetical protein [Fluviicola sp.]|uniref:hypothetical protein n=1 Tax=Fluviicola sp. TaxID=1917219 RepID=UPI0031D67E44